MQPLAFVLPVAVGLPINPEPSPVDHHVRKASRDKGTDQAGPHKAKPEVDFSQTLSAELKPSSAHQIVRPTVALGEAHEGLSLSSRLPPLAWLLRGERVETPEESEEPAGLAQLSTTATAMPLQPEPILQELPPEPMISHVCLPLPAEPFPLAPGEETPPLQTIELPRVPQQVLGQVMQTVRGQQVLTQLDFQITPPAVGPVNLQVSYTQGVVGVQLTALSLQAKHTLESQLSTIHATLVAHNLTPGPMKVVLAPAGRFGASAGGSRHEGSQTGFGGQASRRRGAESADDPARAL
jgi:flagellar hook-length control protein FliK